MWIHCQDLFIVFDIRQYLPSELHSGYLNYAAHSLTEPPIMQPFKNFPASMEPEGSLSCSQEPSTGPYPEPDKSNPYHLILTLSTHLRLGLPSGLFPSGFPTNILYAFLFSSIRTTCPAHLILLEITWLLPIKSETSETMKCWFVRTMLANFVRRPLLLSSSFCWYTVLRH
jgi:hypothetical protein